MGAIIAGFATLSRAPNLIPGNVGIKEAVFILISSMYGVTANEALHAAAIHRIIGTSTTLFLAPFCAHWFSSQRSAREETVRPLPEGEN